jgi:putative ABC transport system ATP-binding protein
VNSLGLDRHVVDVNKVTKVFQANEDKTVAVRNISLQFFPGELSLLLGPSGSGKTTLLLLISGLLKPTEGTVSLFGRNVNEYTQKALQQVRATKIGFIFQTFLLIDSLTVRENVELIMEFGDIAKIKARQSSKMLLDQFHVGHLIHKYPSEISQGQKQRVAVVRAIANDPSLIIADEPTASLESKQGFDIIQLLHTYAKEHNKTIIIASHDSRISGFADRIIQMEDGMLKSSSSKE